MPTIKQHLNAAIDATIVKPAKAQKATKVKAAAKAEAKPRHVIDKSVKAAPAPKIKLMTGATAITKAIESIRTRGAKLDHDIWVAAISVMQHAAEHGDTTLADRIMQAMPKGSRKHALMEFMLAFSPLAKLEKGVDDAAIKAGRLFKLDRSKKLQLAEAMGISWVEFKREPDLLEAFDMQLAVQQLVNRIQRAKDQGLTIENTIQAEAKLKELMASLV